MSNGPSPLPNGTDSKWLIGIQAGDQEAFQSLYRVYRARLFSFVRRFANSPELVEEIVNDSFMAIWMHAKSFRAESQVSTWIFGIAYRLSMKANRRRRAWAPLNDLSTANEPSVDPSKDFEKQDLILHAMESLAPDQRDTLTLAYLYGFSVLEIASLTRSPAGTVKSRMFHGRNYLRARALAFEQTPNERRPAQPMNASRA